MKKVTLRNRFHATEVTVVVPLDGILSRRTSARVRRELCGVDGCDCEPLNGHQAVRIHEDNDGCYVIN